MSLILLKDSTAAPRTNTYFPLMSEVVDVGSLIVAGRPKEGSERGMEEVRGLPSRGRCGESPGLCRDRGRGPSPGAEGRTGRGTPAVWDR